MNSRLWAVASAIAIVTAVGAYGSSASAAAFTTGDVFASVGSDHVNHYSAAGAFIEQLNTGQGGSFTTGMAFDGGGNLLVTNFDKGNITKFSNTGVIVPPNPLASPGSNPESIAFNSAGDFYVGRASGAVQKYSAGGALLQTLGTGSSDWIDLAANQTTLFYNDESGTIRRFDTATNSALADFANNGANGGSASYALRILGNGDVLSAANQLVLQYNAAGALLGSYDVSGVDGFFGLNLDPNGTSFWSGSYNNGTLYKFNLGSFGGNTSIQSINTGSGSLFGVAVAGEITAGGPGPGVPEPATWAMMLIGFGGLGAVVRRRRAQSAAAAA